MLIRKAITEKPIINRVGTFNLIIMTTLQLISLKCKKPSDGTDEVYFEYKIDNSSNVLKIPNDPSDNKSWNFSVGNIETFQPESSLENGTVISGNELTFNFSDQLILEIKDHDKGSKDDPLGSLVFNVKNGLPTSPQILQNIDSDDEYELTFSYVN